MGSLQAIPAEAPVARIAVIDALGKTRNPAILRSMVLMTGAGSKDVRKAVAVALGCIRHSLSAYLLLPMLNDKSSRVRNAAIQALLHIGQPHCAEVFVAAGVKSNTFRNITTDTIRLLQPDTRKRFEESLKTIVTNGNLPAAEVLAGFVSVCQQATLGDPSATKRKSPADSQPDSPRPEVRANSDRGTANGRRPFPDAAAESHVSLEFDALQKTATSDPEIDFNNRELADLVSVPSTDSMLEGGITEAMGSGDSFADFSFFQSMSEDLSNSPEFMDVPQGEFVLSSGGSHVWETGRTASSDSAGTSASELDFVRQGVSGSVPHPDSGGRQTSPASLKPRSGLSNAVGIPHPSGVHSSPFMDQLAPASSHSGHPLAFSQPNSWTSNSTPAIPAAAGPSTVAPAFPVDLTASSPLIPAFSSAPTAPWAAGGFDSGVVAQMSGGHASPGSTATSMTATLPPVAPPVTLSVTTEAHDENGEAAELSRTIKERNLKRLREARETAYHRILEHRETIDSKTPRLISKKISALMATPSSDIEKVMQLIRSLGQTRSSYVIEALGSFCQKSAKEIRIATAEALGSIPHQGSAMLLMRLLSDKSGTVVERTTASLVSINQQAVWPVVLAAGLVNNSLRNLVSSGIEARPDDEKPKWEQFLLTQMSQPDVDPDLTAFSLSILVRLTAATHVEIYQKLVEHDSAIIRVASVEALARTGEKRVIGAINEALLDADPRVRSQAAIAIAAIHSPRSITLLKELLRDADVEVRRAAAQSASRIDEEDLGLAITEALVTESDSSTVESLLYALNRNGGKESLSVLTRYVEGNAGQYRDLAMKALRRLKAQESIPVFERLLDDSSPAIRRQSIEQLAVLKVETALPRIRDLLKKDADEVVRGSCARAIGEMQDRASLQALEDALEDHAVVRLQAVIALGRLGLQEAGPVLLNLLQDSQPEIRYQAVRAIGQLKLKGCEECIEALLDDNDEMVRRGAEQSLLEFGFTASRLRRRRISQKLVSFSSKLMPSTLAGAIPGGVSTLAGVIVVGLIIGSYWTFEGFNFAITGGEDLPVGWITALDVNAETKIAAALREDSVLDVWSLENSELITRISVPETTTGVLVEPKGGVILLMENEIGRLDPESDYSVDEMVRAELPGKPSAVTFHDASGSFCFFHKGDSSTSLQVVDAVSLQETRSFKINGLFEGSCTVSPDFSVAVTLDSKGLLMLADLKSGEIVSAPVSNLLGPDSKLGQVYAVTFTGNMKHFVFCATGGCAIIDAGNLTMVRKIDSPDAYGFISAKATNSASDLVILSATGAVYTITDEFKNVVDARIERDESFDLAAVSSGGELVAVANTEGYDFDVYSVVEKRTLMKSTQ